MRNRSSSYIYRWGSLALSLLAVILTVLQLVQYSRSRQYYPLGMTIAGVPVGGLDPEAARQRLLRIYSVPVELYYGESIIHLDPGLVGFELNLESMLAAADLERSGSPFWSGFWDYLWNREPIPSEIPFASSVSEERLRNYLINEIAPRYDVPPIPPQPIAGSTQYLPGQPGQSLDIERAIILIDDALRSATSRVVILTTQEISAGRPGLSNLKVLLQQIIRANTFIGIAGIYMLDLQTGEEIHFGYRGGEDISVEPDIAFSASSTIKIPIMTSVYLYFNGQLDEKTAELMLNMIQKSINASSDTLMDLLDPTRGPLVVSENMKILDLENTFLAGYFCSEEDPCPPLKLFNTPANTRADVTTYPEIYNQTTPSDMGTLLADIYQCAEYGGGALMVSFPGQLTSSACAEMIEYLKEDQIGVLIQSGVPEGTAVAHKHGWTTYGGIIQDVSDAAIVYTPGGDYVLSIYVYEEQIIWNNISLLYAELSRAVYNYYNMPIE